MPFTTEQASDTTQSAKGMRGRHPLASLLVDSPTPRHSREFADHTPSYARLSPLDNLFLLLEGKNTHMHVGITAIFEGAPLAAQDGSADIARIRTYVASRLPAIPRYRQRLAYSPLRARPVWVDDEHFDITHHVRHIKLPRPGSTEQLREISGWIKSQQLAREKPLWEMWIVEGLQGGRLAMITKAHHCMIDGVSGAELLGVLLQPSPCATSEPCQPFTPRPGPNGLGLLLQELDYWLRTPLNLAARLAREPQLGLRRLRETIALLGDLVPAALWSASGTPFNQPIGPHRRFAWHVIDLAGIKAIKNRLGGTVNDVVLAIVSGAIRRFLQGRNVDVDALDVRALVPVSTRAPDERTTLGNRVGAWIVDLPVATREPRHRLERLQSLTTALKSSQRATALEALAEVGNWVGSTAPSLAVQLALRARPFNLVVTNVPGPQLPLYLMGARMLGAYPQVPLFTNQGLGVAILSYAGKLHWGFNADWELVPDLRDFVYAIEEAFDELHKAATQERSRPKQQEVSPVGGQYSPYRYGEADAEQAAVPAM